MRYSIKIKMFCLFLIACVLISCTPKKNDAKKNTYIERTGFALDTVVNFKIYDVQDERILDEAMQLCERMELIFSSHLETSELYQVNHRTKGNREIVISKDLAKVMERALYFCEMSDGAFDITIEPVLGLWDFHADLAALPDAKTLEEAVGRVDYKKVVLHGNTLIFSDDETRIDLGAIAKGYIADQIGTFFIEQGVKSALINLGGNVLCIGGKNETEGFAVGLQMPFGDREDVLGFVQVRDASVVSSGVYERNFEIDGVNYHHLLNTDTGYPIQNGLTQVSIISPSSMDADALSTVCFALGEEEGLAMIQKFPNTFAYFIHENGEVLYSQDAK